VNFAHPKDVSTWEFRLRDMEALMFEEASSEMEKLVTFIFNWKNLGYTVHLVTSIYWPWTSIV
jgi:hypothetical protein